MRKGNKTRKVFVVIAFLAAVALSHLIVGVVLKALDDGAADDGTDGANGGRVAPQLAAGDAQLRIIPAPRSPPNLPSVRTTVEEEAAILARNNNDGRSIYGGKGDQPHLGGFTHVDPDGLSPALMRHMLVNMTVKSVVDVGCGRGLSTLWFMMHGAEVLCVEGSNDAVTRSVLPADKIVEHDFQRGPWWPDSKTYDIAWSVEFLEHVGRQYMHNYIPVFNQAALLFVTQSDRGGWHHVEVHEADPWWHTRFAAFGFVHAPGLTHRMRRLAYDHRENAAFNRVKFSAQHLHTLLEVYINPRVASKPEHAHLLGGFGCTHIEPTGVEGQQKQWSEPCAAPDNLPPQFLPLADAMLPDEDWEHIIFAQEKGISSRIT